MRTAISAAIAASFGTMLVSGAAIAAPQAEAAEAACAEGSVCIYSQDSYKGSKIDYASVPAVPRSVQVSNVGEFMNDRTTSAWNRTDHSVCFHDSIDFGEEPLFVLQPGEANNNVGDANNDRVSSLRNC